MVIEAGKLKTAPVSSLNEPVAGASKVVGKSKSSLVGVSQADKCAFSEVQPTETSCVSGKGLVQSVNSVNNAQVSSERCPEVSSVFTSRQSREQRNWGTCLESNIFIILSIIFAVIIGLLELCREICIVWLRW